MATQRRPRFAADLSQCLFDFVIQLLPPPDELLVKENVRRLLQRLIRNIEPSSRLLAFGSTANGFSLRNSDMDLCCLIDSGERLNPSDLVTRLGDLLERETRFHVKRLPHARIPIVKLALDPSPGLPSGIACDIGFENRLAIENTRLLLTYAKIDPTRVRTLVLFLKIWSKRRKINSPYKGTLSSYGYVLLVIYFLVHVKNPPVLPNLQQMPPLRPIKKDDTTLNGYNVWFFDDTDILCQRWQSENTDSVAELLIDFFRYFSRDFLYNTGVASIRAGLLKKDVKGWQNDLSPTSGRYDPARERNRFCVEDPFETDYNVARCVTKDGLYTIRGEFMRASRILSIRPERAIMALAELCEERKEEDLVPAPHGGHHHIPYIGNGGGHAAPAKLSIPPQTPYSIGSQSRSSLRVAPGLSPRITITAGSTSGLQVVDENSILTTTRTNKDGTENPPTEPVDVPLPPSPTRSPLPHSPAIATPTSTSNIIPPILNNTTNATKSLTIASPLALNAIPNFVPRSTIPDQPHPEHMAPRRSKWTSPPPADAPFVDRTMYENSLDRSLELATAPVGEARETCRYRKKRSKRDGEDVTRWEEEEEEELEMEEEDDDDDGSVVETLSEVGSVRSFTEGMHFGSSGNMGNNAIMNFSGILGNGYSGVRTRGPLRRPSWHVMDSLPRGWVPPSFVPSSNALQQLSQQQGEQQVNEVGSPTPAGNGFSNQQSPRPLSREQEEGISQQLEAPRGSITPSSTSPTAVSAGQSSPPIPFHNPSVPVVNSPYQTSSPYIRRPRPPLQQQQQQQQQQHPYRHQNRGGYNVHQPNLSSPLIPVYDSPESFSPALSNFESASPSFTAATTGTTTTFAAGNAGGNSRFNNGGSFASQKVRGEGSLGSPSSPRVPSSGVAQSPRFHRHQHHQHHQHHYQHRNAYGGGYQSPPQQQQQQQNPQSPSGLAVFDSYALQLAMSNLNVINSFNGMNGMNAMDVMNTMNTINAMSASPTTTTRITTTTTTTDGGNNNGNAGTTVYYQTTAPRSPRIVMPMHASSSNASSPQIGSGGGTCSSPTGSGSGATSPVGGGIGTAGGGGVEENVLPANLPSIGLLRHGHRNGYGGTGAGVGPLNGVNGVESLYAASSGYHQFMMASSLGNVSGGLGGSGFNRVGYQRSGFEEERTGGGGGNQEEEQENGGGVNVLTSPATTTAYRQSSTTSTTPVQGNLVDHDGDNGGGDDDTGHAGGGENSVGSNSSSSSSSTATDTTTATTAMTANSSSSPVITATTTTTPPSSTSTPAMTTSGASANSSSPTSYSSKAKAKSRIKTRIGGGRNGGKSKSRSPSPFVRPVVHSTPSSSGHSPAMGMGMATPRITKEEEERFHSSATVASGSISKEEKIGGKSKKNGGGGGERERERKNGNVKAKTNGSAATGSSLTKNGNGSGNSGGAGGTGAGSSNSKARGKQKGKQRKGGNNNNNNNKKGGDQPAQKPSAVAVASSSATAGGGNVAGSSS